MAAFETKRLPTSVNKAVGRHADCPICQATDREAYLEDPRHVRNLVVQLGRYIQALALELDFLASEDTFDFDRPRLASHQHHLRQIYADLERRLPPLIDRDDWEEHYARDEWDQPPTKNLAIPEAKEQGS